MPYIGNPIYQNAFVTDQFSGNGSTTAFTMSVAPAGVSNVLVAVSGVLQDPSTYGVAGNTITFSTAPPSGTGNISCRYLGVPVTGIVTTAYRTVTEFTATASQTTFTPPSYTVGFINVYLNGVLLGSADYTATNGTTVVLATGASAGNLVTVESFRVETVLNAISNSAGSVSSSNIAGGAVTPAKLSTGGPSWATTGQTTINSTTAASAVILNSTNAGGTALNIQNSGTVNALLGGYNSIVGSGNATDIMLSANQGALAFGTNGVTERMRIDSSGRVTTPYQPGFKQAFDTTNTGTPGDVIISTTNGFSFLNSRDVFNTGSHYNQTTGLFTAPVAGTYIFGLSFMRNNANGSIADFRLTKNGTTANLWGRAYSTYVSTYQQLTFTTVTVAAAGDAYGFLISRGQTSVYNDDSYIWGYLLG